LTRIRSLAKRALKAPARLETPANLKVLDIITPLCVCVSTANHFALIKV
jgi:hypothetical protein